MSANTQPIWTRSINRNACVFTSTTTASAKSDGSGTIGTDLLVLWTADVTNGGFFRKGRIMPFASAANTAVNGTVLRFFVTTVVSGVTTSANTHLLQEFTLTAVTGASSTTQNNPQDWVMNEAFQSGDQILVSIHAQPAANTGWQVTGFGGNY